MGEIRLPRPCERPCISVHDNPHVTAGTCGICWRAIYTPEGIALWGKGCTDDKLKEVDKVTELINSPVDGPGTELKKLLSELGIEPGGCQCNAHVQQMNLWGPLECTVRRAEIVAWLQVEQERLGWGRTLLAGLRAITSGLVFKINPADPAGSLVDEAIRRAEKKV